MRILYLVFILTVLIFNSSCSRRKFWNDKKPKQPLKELTKLSKQVVETSGLVSYDNRIWTINDSGDASYLYEINREDGSVIKKIDVKDAKNKDWELLTRDDTYLYIGDTGNNNEDREKLTIIKVALKNLARANAKVAHAGKIVFNYPSEHPNYNCEAMIVINNQLGLFTKNGRRNNTQFFTLEKSIGQQEAVYHGEFASQGLVTAASYHEDKLVLLGYSGQEGFQPFLWVFDSFEVDNPFASKPKGYVIEEQLQFEAIIHDQGNNYLISNEGRHFALPTLWEFTLNQ